jgi:ribosomal-protein-alanine N-acetyltransferase
MPDTYVLTRWFVRRDLEDVLPIEAASFEFPWSEDDFLQVLKRGHCNMLVADLFREVAGYAVIHQHPDAGVHVLNLAVRPGMRRLGVGRQLIERLQQRLRPGQELFLEVRDTSLPAHLFFRAAGLTAIKVLRRFYPDSGNDAYRFRYVAPQPARVGAEAACEGR